MKKYLILGILVCLPAVISSVGFSLDIEVISKDELLIAKMLHHEACDDTELNRQGLVHLVHNRVSKGKSAGYEDTVEKVLNQPGQFKGFSTWPLPCDKCIKSVVNAREKNPLKSTEITHYLSKWDTKLKHIAKVKVLQKLGGHEFGIYIWNK